MVITLVCLLCSVCACAASTRGFDAGADAECPLQLQQPPRGEAAQRADFELAGEQTAFLFSLKDQGDAKDTPAVATAQLSRRTHPFMATFPNNGITQAITFLKPCGIIKPHMHPRGSELYTVIYGDLVGAVSQEVGSLENITVVAQPGEIFMVPQGLMHIVHNPACTPTVFFQTFDHSDAGRLDIVNALSALERSGDLGAAAVRASGVEVSASEGFVKLDEECLARCGFPETGAPGDGLPSLPKAFRRMIQT